MAATTLSFGFTSDFSSTILFLPGDPVFLNFVSEDPFADSQALGRSGLDASVLPERLCNKIPFNLREHGI